MNMTDCFFTYFVLQSIVCAGMIIWNFVKEKNFVGQILVFVLLYSSLYSTYLWTGKLDHEWKFKSVPLSITRSPQLVIYLKSPRTRLRHSLRQFHLLREAVCKAESCFLMHSNSAWVWIVFSHMVLFLGVFDSRPQSAQLSFGDTERTGTGESRGWAERSEACKVYPRLPIRVQLNWMKISGSALSKWLHFCSLHFLICKTGSSHLTELFWELNEIWVFMPGTR